LKVIRPNTALNRQANRAYAEEYAAHHRAAGDSLEARLAVEDLLLLDGILRDYRLLDVGCGTGGYLRFVRNHQHITALDFSHPLIEKARELQIEFGIQRVEYVVSRFEDYEIQAETFDAVRLRGTFGAYQPWPSSLHAVKTAKSALRSGGIAIASYFRPPTLFHRLKSTVLPYHTLAISKKRFDRLWEDNDFLHLFDIDLGTRVIVFLQKK